MSMDTLTTRREFLIASGILTSGLILDRTVATAHEPAAAPRCALGLASNVFDIRRAADSAAGKHPSISDPLELFKECQALGASGMQAPIGVRDDAYAATIKRFADDHGLYVEASIMPPKEDRDVERFEKEIVTAKAAGATLARTVVFPGRRYETFHSPQEFSRASQRALEMLRRAEPILRRQRFRFAVENHKDQRVTEKLDLLKRVGSEWIGICVDVGNSFALCEDPLAVVRTCAPLAFTAHFKDQAVREYEDGFLFADVPLGKGFLDLAQIARLLRTANPQIRLNLEVMTRDPLKVPVLTSGYWATMADVPAADLARTLRTVKTKAPTEPLPTVSSLPIDQQVRTEAENIRGSIAYARQQLNL